MTKKINLHEEERKTIKEQVKQHAEKHRLRMIELKYSRESEAINHEDQMKRQRIKTAEIRKMQERKDWHYNSGNYKGGGRT